MSDEPRNPLKPLPPEKRHAVLQEMGLDDNMVPLTATEAEKQAAAKPWPEFKKMEPKPFFSAKSINILAAVGSFLGIAAGVSSGLIFFPAWVPFVLSAFGAISLHLAGRAMPALKIGEHPLAPEKAIPLFKGAAVAVSAFASSFPAGHVQGGLLVLAAILYGVAGLAAPQDITPVETPK